MATALFRTRHGTVIHDHDIVSSLRDVGSQDCDVLFVHSEMSFGTPVTGIRRQELLTTLLNCLRALRVETIVMPTFTFSFCNGINYDVKSSRSKMGSLNEHFRSQPGVVRSTDPLMSCAAEGRELTLVNSVGQYSCGEGSTFDLLHKTESRVKFLFLGVEPAKCMTYTHYVEERLGVPYRYNRPFTGRITDGQGRNYEKTYQLYVRYKGVTPIPDDRFQSLLIQKNVLKWSAIGDSKIFCINEKDAYASLESTIQINPNYFITEPFNRESVTTDFSAHDMVAL